MNYQSTIPASFISISEIYTIHYFEYMNDFSFEGESHDFWELVCVDQGKVVVNTEQRHYILSESDIIFHQPNEFHNIRATDYIAPNLIVISFASHSPAMSFFKQKLLTLNATEKLLLANIITEARSTYSTILGHPYYTKLTKNTHTSPDSEHLIKLYLELFLIYLHRRYNYNIPSLPLSFESDHDHILYHQIHDYLVENIREHLTLKKISTDLLLSTSKLQKIIRRYHDCSLIEYFSLLKIDFAKQLIRTNTLTLSQIADYLGYSSIHYFSRQFKLLTHMPPSHYATTIKALVEYPHNKEVYRN